MRAHERGLARAAEVSCVTQGDKHHPTFSAALGFCCIPKYGVEGAAGGHTDLLLVLMSGGRWSVLQLEMAKGGISFRPALLLLDGSDEATPAHGALRLEPGVPHHRHPAGAITTQRDGPNTGEHSVLVTVWASTMHLLTFQRCPPSGEVRLDVRAAIEDVDSLALGLHVASPQRHILGWCWLQSPNDLDFEGYPLAVALLADTAHAVHLEAWRWRRGARTPRQPRRRGYSACSKARGGLTTRTPAAPWSCPSPPLWAEVC